MLKTVIRDGIATLVELTEAELAQREADRAAQIAQWEAEAVEQGRLSTFFGDAKVQDIISRLRAANAGQIDTWVANNVTTLAQARDVLATILKFLAWRLK